MLRQFLSTTRKPNSSDIRVDRKLRARTISALMGLTQPDVVTVPNWCWRARPDGAVGAGENPAGVTIVAGGRLGQMRKEREDGRLTRTSRAEETVGTFGVRRSEAEGSLHWTRRTHARSMFAVIFGRYSERRRRGAGEDHDATQRPLELGEIEPTRPDIASVKSRLPGDIVSVEIEHCGPAWDYGLRVLGGKDGVGA